MKLTRVVHMGGVQAVYAPVGRLLPDIHLVPGTEEKPAADHCLMFIDGAAGEAHAFLFTVEQARELAELILAPTVEVVRTFPGGMLGANGDVPAA